ncbi:MAG TPA: hypothetical protein VJ652_18700 [Noviherbaspirillum sp.]|nr:hypothetical protein [Noviherbaspirillum sp.]
MIEPTAIFQRTQTGRDEIYEKKRGLTQSERLVLIMIDGTTPYQGVRSKLPVLAEERFQRALTTLLKKDLILEVFLPVEGQQPEEMEQTVIDRFIQQDPTDPLTIISFDPEEDFGVFGPAVPVSGANGAPMPPAEMAWSPAPESAPGTSQPPPPANRILDETLIQQVDALAQEVRAHRPHYEKPIEQIRDRQAHRQTHAERKPLPAAPAKRAGPHWGYWLIAVGLAFIIGFVVARLSH